MRLVQTDNLEFLKKKYIEDIEQTPDFMCNTHSIDELELYLKHEMV